MGKPTKSARDQIILAPTVHTIHLLEFPWTFTYQTSWENNNNNKDMNDIFYNITRASLSWNPFIHFRHTIHIIPPPDIVTRWHIQCLIYCLCTIQVLIKQQRSPHSWCHYTNFQKGAAPLSSPLQHDHRALSLARGPVTLPPNPLRGSWHLCDEGPLWVCAHPESWQMEHIIFYILNRPPTLNTDWHSHGIQ